MSHLNSIIEELETIVSFHHKQVKELQDEPGSIALSMKHWEMGCAFGMEYVLKLLHTKKDLVPDRI